MYLLDSSLINQVLLGVTAFVLLCGSAGMLLISYSSPLLRGLVWVSGSFFLGGASSLLLCAHRHLSPCVSQSVADLMMLGCLVFLHFAVLAVRSKTPRVSRLSFILLTTQAVLSVITLSVPGTVRLRIFGAAVLLTVKALASGWELIRHRDETARAPALMCGSLLWSYGFLCLLSAFAATGTVRLAANRIAFNTALSMTMLATILGIAFGFFWMTTSVFASDLEHMASTDPLTRIFNRRTFLLWCEKELSRSFVSGAPFSLLLLDLDHFKHVNDRFGHGVGDRVLCATVERVQDAVRGIDVLSRWGGEEFAVLLPRASAEAAFLVAERVRGNIERSTLPLTELEARGHSRLLQVTASLGAATFAGPDDSLAAMFQRADAALYAAKRGGRNRTIAAESHPLFPEPMLGGEGPAALPEVKPTSAELVV